MHHELNDRLSALERRLGVAFRKRELLIEALAHRSHLNECRSCTRHNERLEFLGDAVLEYIVTEWLFTKYPEMPEGDLTDIRTRLVRLETLAGIGQTLRLDDTLLMSKGERLNPEDSQARRCIRANAMEALIGALCRDQGTGACRLLVDTHILVHINAITAMYDDPKSELQMIAQSQYHVTPHYEVVAESGPDHDRLFRVAVHIGAMRVAEGEGPSKKRAEEDAARHALAIIEQRTNPNHDARRHPQEKKP